MDNSSTEGVQETEAGVTNICDYELLKSTNKEVQKRSSVRNGQVVGNHFQPTRGLGKFVKGTSCQPHFRHLHFKYNIMQFCACCSFLKQSGMLLKTCYRPVIIQI